MKREAVVCEDVESVFPPYPVAVKAAGLVFLSGMRGPSRGIADVQRGARGGARQAPRLYARRPRRGLVTADSWGAHDNMEKVLQAAGSTGDQVLRQHVWQRDKRFFPSYEAVRKHWQPSPAPSSGLGVGRV